MPRNRGGSNHAAAATPNSDEAETAVKGKPHHGGVSEYEKQRLSRIAENKARLEALGLSKISSSFNKCLTQNSRNNINKGKKKVQDEDDEYKPENEEPESSSSVDEDHDDKDEDFEVDNAFGSRKGKMKNKCLKTKAKISGKKSCSNMENIDDEDEALRQAIALSLQDSAEDPYFSKKNVVNITGAEKGNIQVEEDKGRKKSKKSFTSRLQMTEDELIVHFFQLDEAGKGTVSVRDLRRAAEVHDFIWTDKELFDMIRFFDGDGDGKLSFDDFKKIVVRCNMIEGTSNLGRNQGEDKR